jgi:hypothetical protein
MHTQGSQTGAAKNKPDSGINRYWASWQDHIGNDKARIQDWELE